MAGKPDMAEHSHVLQGVEDTCIEFKAADDKAMAALKRRFGVFKRNYQVEFYAPEDPLKGKYIEVEDSELFGGHTEIQGINGARITCLDALNVEQCSPLKGGLMGRGGPGFNHIFLTVDGVLMSYSIKYDSKESQAPAQDQ